MCGNKAGKGKSNFGGVFNREAVRADCHAGLIGDGGIPALGKTSPIYRFLNLGLCLENGVPRMIKLITFMLLNGHDKFHQTGVHLSRLFERFRPTMHGQSVLITFQRAVQVIPRSLAVELECSAILRDRPNELI